MSLEGDMAYVFDQRTRIAPQWQQGLTLRFYSPQTETQRPE